MISVMNSITDRSTQTVDGYKNEVVTKWQEMRNRQSETVLTLVGLLWFLLVYRWSLTEHALNEGGRVDIDNVVASYTDAEVSPKHIEPSPRREAIHGIQHLHDHPRRHAQWADLYAMVNVEDIGVASENCLHANDVWKLDNLLKYCIAAVTSFAYEVSDIITPSYRLMLPLHPPSLEKLW